MELESSANAAYGDPVLCYEPLHKSPLWFDFATPSVVWQQFLATTLFENLYASFLQMEISDSYGFV
ncbi:hypothetical protein KSX_49000 [Ktedonospora formicarum]|uniref:Uncharacterized protein n=1 Tax=Ktedonospora formicarum TaxID=2778364 RepID=A0A8J3MS49_9CHLR|nr:hypothetical protein KSX_49000 [Ktedonospora formicarum]